MRGDPLFLRRHAHPDKKERGLRLADTIDDRICFSRREETMESPGKMESGKFGRKSPARLLRDSRSRSQEECRMPLFCGHSANREHQIDPWSKFGERRIKHATRPKDPGGFRHHKRRALEDLPKFAVVFSIQHHQRIARDDVMRPACQKKTFYLTAAFLSRN